MANKPIKTLRDGSLKATIWKRSSENGDFYSVHLTRSYTDSDGKWHDSSSFVGAEILRMSHLAQRAYDLTVEFKRQQEPTPAIDSRPDDGRLS